MVHAKSDIPGKLDDLPIEVLTTFFLVVAHVAVSVSNRYQRFEARRVGGVRCRGREDGRDVGVKEKVSSFVSLCSFPETGTRVFRLFPF